MSMTASRELASAKAKNDTAGAFKIAEKIADPWYRAQALATVGRFADSSRSEAILNKSVEAAFEASDPFRTVAVSSWPLRAYIELKNERKCRQVLSRILDKADLIENPVCRCDALILVYQAVFSLGSSVRADIVNKAIGASHHCNSWKCQLSLMNLATFVFPHEPTTANKIVESMAEGRFKRKAKRLIGEGITVKPREFFVCQSEYVYEWKHE